MKKAFIQLHIAVFLAGFTAVLGRLINLNEGLLVWYRLLITVIVLAIMLYAKKEFIKIAVKDILRMAAVGGIIAFHWVTFYGSVKYGNISVALVCISAAGPRDGVALPPRLCAATSFAKAGRHAACESICVR